MPALHVLSKRTVAILGAAQFALVPMMRGAAPKAMSPQQKELLRRQKIVVAFAKNPGKPSDLVRSVYEPMIRANRDMIASNQELADRFLAKAKDYADKGDEANRERYKELGDLFAEYVACNRKVIAAITESRGSDLNNAFTEIERIESGIYEITRKRVKRDWFLPKELQAAPATLGGKK